MKTKKLPLSLLIVIGVLIIGIAVATVSFFSEKKQTDISHVFDVYTPVGLIFNKTDQTLSLGNEIIRYFHDENRELSYLNEAGTIDVVPIYKASTIVTLRREDEATFLENEIKLKEQGASLNAIRISYQGKLYFRF